MAVQLFTNNAVSTLAANLSIGATSMSVAVGEGALFPTLSGGDWFNVTLESGANREIVKVTARAGDVFTIVRAQEGTSDQSWTTGDTVELRVTNAWLSRVHTEDSLPAASIGDVVGPAGGVVDNEVVFFDNTTGKLVKGSGLTLSGSNTGDQVISDATLSTTDITTNDFSTSKHGFVPKGTNVGKYLKDDGTWALIPDILYDPIINGCFNVWQRQTSWTAVANATTLADRWKIGHSMAGSIDAARLALGDAAIFTAAGQLVNYGLRLTVNSADATVGATDVVTIGQRIEGYRAVPFMHNEFTVSVLVRSNITGTFALSVRNSGNDRSYVKEFTIDAANTWERKTITIPAQDRTGTWNYTTGVGLNVSICLMAGTSFQGTDATWNSANNTSTSSQTNWMATGANTFDIACLQIDNGPQAYPIRGRDFAEDLQLCLRYFQKTYAYGTFPGALSVVNTIGFKANQAAALYEVEFLPMRSTPTLVHYSYATGASGQWRDVTGGADVAITNNNGGDRRSTVSFTTTDGNQIAGHWTADSEI